MSSANNPALDQKDRRATSPVTLRPTSSPESALTTWAIDAVTGEDLPVLIVMTMLSESSPIGGRTSAVSTVRSRTAVACR